MAETHVVPNRFIFCCGAKAWSRFIGWTQVVSGAVIILLIAIFLSSYGQKPERYVVNVSQSVDWGNSRERQSEIQRIFLESLLKPNKTAAVTLEQERIIRATLIVGIVAAAIAILMGFLLIFATYEKNVIILHLWIVYAIISLLYFFIFKIIELVFNPSTGRILLVACQLLLTSLVQLLLIKVVCIFKDECQSEQRCRHKMRELEEPESPEVVQELAPTAPTTSEVMM